MARLANTGYGRPKPKRGNVRPKQRKMPGLRGRKALPRRPGKVTGPKFKATRAAPRRNIPISTGSAPHRNLPVVKSKRPLKAKGKIVKGRKAQKQRVKAAKQRFQAYRKQALRSGGGRPLRPYEQAQYDPGMQPTGLDDYIRDNDFDEAIWQLTREDPYFDAPYAEDDDLAGQAGDYGQMWTSPYLSQADERREGYYDRFGEYQEASRSATAGSRYAPTNNPYDRTVAELLEGGPGLAQDTFGDLLTDRRNRATGRADRSKDFADFWADLINDFQSLEFDKTGGRQDFMGDMIKEATRDVQHREKLGQGAREFRAKLTSDERESMAKLKQDIAYENRRLKQYGGRNKTLARQGDARLAQANERNRQAAARLGISQAYLKKAQRESNKTVDVYQSRVRGYLVNKFGKPILRNGKKVKVPKKARVGTDGGGGGGGASSLDDVFK